MRETSYRLTSAADRQYNCIAWAAGDTATWWWPGGGADDPSRFWPLGAPHEETITAFLAAFATVGYVSCQNDALETDTEKIALFAHADDVPTHAARQLPNGFWTSKLGAEVDLEHALQALTGDVYGRVIRILKRPHAS